jgi:uncharacterized protein
MILVDTGAWLGLADRGDIYHERCRTFFRTNSEPLMTTYPVLVECVHLMFKRIGVAQTLAWLETLNTQGEGRIVSSDERDFHAFRWKHTHPFQNLL